MPPWEIEEAASAQWVTRWEALQEARHQAEQIQTHRAEREGNSQKGIVRRKLV